MNTKYTTDPLRYAGFFFAENKVTHPEYEYIIYLGFPRMFLKWKADEGAFTYFDEFFNGIAEIQWLDGIEPPPDTKNAILTDAWNFLCIEDKILEDDINDINDDEI